MAAEVTSITKRMVAPVGNQKVWIYKYTKAGAADTIPCSSEFAALEGAVAQQITGTGGTAGADDPASVATTVATLSTGTGTGVAIVFGTG